MQLRRRIYYPLILIMTEFMLTTDVENYDNNKPEFHKKMQSIKHVNFTLCIFNFAFCILMVPDMKGESLKKR